MLILSRLFIFKAFSIDKVQNIVNRNVLNLYYRIFKIESPARSCNFYSPHTLHNKQLHDIINSCKSSFKQISTGVPQGSILGPILFLVYITYLHNCISLNVVLFADDTTVYCSDPFNKQLVDMINRELIEIQELLCKNGFV